MTTCTQFRDRLRRFYADAPNGFHLCYRTDQEKVIRDALLVQYLYGDPLSVPADHTPLVESSMREALETLPGKGSAEYITWLMRVGTAFGFAPSTAPLLIQLLLRLGHHTHEEIVTELDSLEMPLAIPAFVFAAKHRKHLVNGEYGDDGDAMARKAVWALGKLRRTDTNSGEAEAALCELAELKDRKVARYATSMLKRGEC